MCKKRRIFTTSVCLCILGTAQVLLGASKGWRYPRYDLVGSNFYPHSSAILTSDTLVKQWSVSLPTGRIAGSILTGDITGDKYLEIICVRDSILSIYNHNGIEIHNIKIGGYGWLRMIEDVNGDSILDIGIGTCWYGNPTVWFYDGAGNLLNTFSKPGGYDAGMWPVTVLKGGKVVVSHEAGYSWAQGSRGFAIFDYTTGNELWWYKVGCYHRTTSVADINGDGKMEFTNSAYTSHNGASGDGYNGNGTPTTDGDFYTIVVDEDGNEVWTVGYTADGESDGCLSNWFVDLNKDDTMEILACEGHDPTYYQGTSQLHILNITDGSIVKTFDGIENNGWEFAIADVNKDGKDEIIAINGTRYGDNATLYILDYELNVVDSTHIDEAVQFVNGILVNDINGDGELEIAVCQDTIIKILDNTFQEKWFFIADTVIIKAIVSDCDSDGKNELIFWTYNSLYVFEGVNIFNGLVLYPNGRESWLVGSVHPIRWEIPEDDTVPAFFRLQFSTDGGASYSVIVDSIPGYIREWDWIVPNTPSNQCRIRVDGMNSNYELMGFDESDEDFIIREVDLSLLSPNGGEVLISDSVYSINWNIRGKRQKIIGFYRISFSLDGGANYEIVKDSLSGFLNSWDWQVPDVNSSSCRIKITAMDLTYTPIAEDESDSNFTIKKMKVEENTNHKTTRLEISSNLIQAEVVINYKIPINSKVSLKLYDTAGRLVSVLVNEEKKSGDYTINFDARNLARGIYFVKFNTSSYEVTKKLVLTK